MTKEDIISMAEEAKIPGLTRSICRGYIDGLERFAALVAAHEREEIAQFVQDFDEFEDDPAVSGTAIIARAIRERGEQ